MKTVLANLQLWQKFALLGLLGLVLFGVPTTLYVLSTERVIRFKKEEIEGVEPVRRLLRSVQLMQQHRGMSAVMLNGAADMVAPRQAKAAEVDQALQALAQAMQGMQKSDAQAGALLQAQVQAWTKVRDAVGARQLAAPESFAAHSAVIGALGLPWCLPTLQHERHGRPPTASTWLSRSEKD